MDSYIWAGPPSSHIMFSTLFSSNISTASSCVSACLIQKNLILDYRLSLPFDFLGLRSSYLDLDLQRLQFLMMTIQNYLHLIHHYLRQLNLSQLSFHLAPCFLMSFQIVHRFFQYFRFLKYLQRLNCLQSFLIINLLKNPCVRSHLRRDVILFHVVEYSMNINRQSVHPKEAVQEGSITTRGSRHSFYNRIQLEMDRAQIHNLLGPLQLDRWVLQLRVNLEFLGLLDQHQLRQTQNGPFQTQQLIHQILHSRHFQQLQVHRQLWEVRLEQQHLVELGFLEQSDQRQRFRHQRHQRMLLLFQKFQHLYTQMQQLLHLRLQVHLQFLQHPHIQCLRSQIQPLYILRLPFLHQQLLRVQWRSAHRVAFEFLGLQGRRQGLQRQKGLRELPWKELHR